MRHLYHGWDQLTLVKGHQSCPRHDDVEYCRVSHRFVVVPLGAMLKLGQVSGYSGGDQLTEHQFSIRCDTNVLRNRIQKLHVLSMFGKSCSGKCSESHVRAMFGKFVTKLRSL